tara:strand:+ start:300 stop:788 length:489 start_codon:yes stop_codon:yes gene_type:complete
MEWLTDQIFSPAVKVIKMRFSLGTPSRSGSLEEKNPIRTPSPSYAKQCPKSLVREGVDLMSPEDKKKRRISFRKGFEMEGTSGFHRAELPYEKQEPEKKKKKKKILTKKKVVAKTKTKTRVKTEATRTSRRIKTMKKGFYSEKRLTDLAWNGDGSLEDPIVF